MSDLHQRLASAEQTIRELQTLYDAAMDYINKSPCDPDIYPDQLEAWNRLQELRKASDSPMTLDEHTRMAYGQEDSE